MKFIHNLDNSIYYCGGATSEFLVGNNRGCASTIATQQPKLLTQELATRHLSITSEGDGEVKLLIESVLMNAGVKASYI
jgi:hypothetical protein